MFFPEYQRENAPALKKGERLFSFPAGDGMIRHAAGKKQAGYSGCENLQKNFFPKSDTIYFFPV